MNNSIKNQIDPGLIARNDSLNVTKTDVDVIIRHEKGTDEQITNLHLQAFSITTL